MRPPLAAPSLVSGLGGGLDAVNALLLSIAARNAGGSPVLASVQPLPLGAVSGIRPFSVSGAWVSGSSRTDYVSSSGLSRFPEPLLAALLGEDVLLLSRKAADGMSPADGTLLLRETVAAFHASRGGSLVFVDGGGDSLVLVPGDASEESEYTDPFGGGDAATLVALAGMDDAVMAIVSAGLDIDAGALSRNLDSLRRRGDYLGWADAFTGEAEGDGFLGFFDFGPQTRREFLEKAGQVLVLDESDLGRPGRMMSHTAVVTYRAVSGDFGLHRTFVPWEPVTADGPGVVVSPEHARVHFIRAGGIHALKLDMNGL